MPKSFRDSIDEYMPYHGLMESIREIMKHDPPSMAYELRTISTYTKAVTVSYRGQQMLEFSERVPAEVKDTYVWKLKERPRYLPEQSRLNYRCSIDPEHKAIIDNSLGHSDLALE